MSFLTKHKYKILTTVCIIAILAVAFFFGDSKQNTASKKTPETVAQLQNEPVHTHQIPATKIPETQKPANTPKIAKTPATPKATPAPDVTLKPQATESVNNQLTCTFSIRCDNAVGKSNEKSAVIPESGVILAEQTVVFYEGESAFNVLVRETKKNKVHLEFVNVPLYNSAYIEGINNLYEFDCGELSGWMYKVNGWFPNYGCSRYELKNGDRIEWVYTCDLGKDVGGDYSARNGMNYE